MYDSMKSLTEEQKNTVHELACGLLSETGMLFALEEARDIFKANGFKIENGRVFITEGQVDNALKTVPAEFDVIAPDMNKKIRIGGNNRVWTPSCSCTKIQDLDGTVRPSTRHDYEKFLRLMQGIDTITCCFEFVVPLDVPQEKHLLFNLYMQMLTIDKTLSCQQVEAIPMLAMFYNTTSDKMCRSARDGLAYGVSPVNPLSPLAMSTYETEKLINFSRCGIAPAIAPYAMCGMTSPCTLEGLIVQQCAEILGGIVLSQLVSEGAPVLYGCLGSITNMSNMFVPVGAPEARIIEHASADMARYYKIPSRSLTGMTDANETDYQSGMESMLNFLVTARSGINFLTGIGSYSNWMIASYEKLILDSESVEYVMRLLRPLDFTDDRAAVDIIQSVITGGSFIEEEHTLEHYRNEFLTSGIFEREPYDKYVSGGKSGVHDKVVKRIDKLLHDYKRPYVEDSTKKQITKYCESHGYGEFIKNIFD